MIWVYMSLNNDICIFILHEYVLKTKYPFPQLRSFVEALNPITTIFGDKDIMEL